MYYLSICLPIYLYYNLGSSIIISCLQHKESVIVLIIFVDIK